MARIQRTFWRRVITRAAKDTFHFLGWNRRTFLVLALFGLGSLVHYWRFGPSATMDEIHVAISYAIAPFGMTMIIILLFKLLAAPGKINHEDNQDKENTIQKLAEQVAILQKKSQTEAMNKAIAKHLTFSYDKGMALLDERITEDQLSEWIERVAHWEQYVFNFLKTKLSYQDASRFARVPYKIENFNYKTSNEHNKHLNGLNAKLHILKQRIDEFKDYWEPITLQEMQYLSTAFNHRTTGSNGSPSPQGTGEEKQR